MVNLAVGDLVVYGAHGPGTVEAREKRSVLGEERTVIVVALAGGLSVQLPLALAKEQLRPLLDEAGIATLEQVLRDRPPPSGDSWLKRHRDGQAKLGHSVGLAEIIRDSSIREAAPPRGGARLSPSERELLRRARVLLTTEIALARHVPIEEAETWLEQQLAPN